MGELQFYQGDKMPSWPNDLPALPLREGYSETFSNTTIRTNMDVGPAKIRRRISYGAAPLSVTLYLTDAEVASLESFYGATLLDGALSFTNVHPRKGTTVTIRFTSPPMIESMGTQWRASFGLEVIP